jgi:hypothetical protein
MEEASQTPKKDCETEQSVSLLLQVCPSLIFLTAESGLNFALASMLGNKYE